MPIISRIVSLKGFSNVICGRDLNKILKEGVVYGLQDIGGVIMLVELGEAAELEKGLGISNIMMGGTYMLTKEEREKELNQF